MKPYERHVFVCLGDNCSGRGADTTYPDALQALVNKAVDDGQVARGAVKVTQAQCLGACGFGPNIAVYPEGVWYYGVKAEDIRDIVDEHLVAGRPVSRLLFHKYGEDMADEVVKDRVCGMVFHISEAQASVQHKEETHYFCSEECRASFQEDPARFLKPHGHGHAHSAKAHSGH